jgi:hypothetical protein
MLARDLQRLNDVLSRSSFADRFWIFGGLLLGWARDGTILLHDTRDVDFAFSIEDLDALYSAVPDLERAGFRRLYRYKNNAGQITELALMRRGARFEFFAMLPQDDDYVYFMYGKDESNRWSEIEVRQPRQELDAFDFLDRRWLKPKDHEFELESTYGNWRVPDPNWSYLSQPNIVGSRPWSAEDFDWKDH